LTWAESSTALPKGGAGVIPYFVGAFLKRKGHQRSEDDAAIASLEQFAALRSGITKLPMKAVREIKRVQVKQPAR
jgi:hypothetical protein